MEELTIQIGGMSCGHCVAAVRSALATLEGVEVQDVGIGAATVQYDAARTTPEAIQSAIREEGYQPRVTA
jgi:copper chaperone